LWIVNALVLEFLDLGGDAGRLRFRDGGADHGAGPLTAEKTASKVRRGLAWHFPFRGSLTLSTHYPDPAHKLFRIGVAQIGIQFRGHFGMLLGDSITLCKKQPEKSWGAVRQHSQFNPSY
jgi:hypothetical protein